MLTTLAALALLAAPPKLAQLEWSTVEVKKELASFFSDELARALRREGLTIVTTSDMAAVIGLERQRQLLGCSEGSCLAELGNAMGCDAVLQVSVARLGDSLRANLKVVKASDGSTLGEAVAEAADERRFVAELERAAGRLASTLLPPPQVTLRQRAAIPAIAGGVVFAGGAVLLGLAINASVQLEATLRTSKQAGLPTAEAYARDGKVYQAVGWVGLGVGAAALATALAFYLFGAEPPVRPQLTLAPTGASVGLAGVWP